MKFLKIFAKNKEKKEIGSFADFFLNASAEDKKKVFTDAAKRANEDQRSLVEHINEIQHKTT